MDEKILFSRETSNGLLEVSQTSTFGTILMLNRKIIISEFDSFYYNEMMVHPALFTHPKPIKIALLGNNIGMLQEVLKHSSIEQVACIIENSQIEELMTQYFSHPYQDKIRDQRIEYIYMSPTDWIQQKNPRDYDIIIHSPFVEELEHTVYQHFHPILKPDGILVHSCPCSLLHVKSLKNMLHHLQQTQFNTWQLLNFPQPSYTHGWRTVMMLSKNPTFKRVREKDIFNRAFVTRYYNFDTHQAALALPEFMKEELEIR